MIYELFDTEDYDGGQTTQKNIDWFKGQFFNIDPDHTTSIVCLDLLKKCSVRKDTFGGISLAFRRFKEIPNTDYTRFFEELCSIN